METDDRRDALDRMFTDHWTTLSLAKNYQGALDFSIATYQLCRVTPGGDKLAELILDPIYVTIEQILSGKNSKLTSERAIELTCSFCGATRNHRDVAAGPTSYICRNCVATLHTLFEGQ